MKIVSKGSDVISWSACAPILLILFSIACDHGSADKQVQERDSKSNIDFEFAINVVDQDAVPLCNASVSVTVFTFSENWDSPAHRVVENTQNLRTDANGAALLAGHATMIRVNSVTYPGFAWLKDLDIYENIDVPLGPGNMFVLSVVGNLGPYLPDKSRPAVFVMVQSGKQEVKAIPCPGGYLAPQHIGGQRALLVPQWPRKPSVVGVRLVPSSQPSSHSSQQ